MKIFFKNILYVLYRYYVGGSTKNVAYSRAIYLCLILFQLNLLTISIVTKLDLKFYFFENLSKIMKYLVFFIISLPFIFLFKRIYPEKDIQEYKPSLNYKLRIYVFFIYFIISLILFAFAINNDR